MEPIDILVGKNFIGNLPASDFRMDSASTWLINVQCDSRVVLNNADFPDFIGNGEFKLKVGNSLKLSDCLKIECKPSEIAFDYKLEAGEQWLAGTSICHSVPCSLSSASHHIKTSNTREIFSLINETEVLNPLYAFYIYSLISSGKKFDLGHEIKIN